MKINILSLSITRFSPSLYTVKIVLLYFYWKKLFLQLNCILIIYLFCLIIMFFLPNVCHRNTLEWSNFKLSYVFICFYDCHFEFMFLCCLNFFAFLKLFTLCLISYILFKIIYAPFYLMIKFFVPSSHKLLLCERWKHVNIPFLWRLFLCSIDLLSVFFCIHKTPTLLHHRNYQQYTKKVCTTKNKPRTLILISLYLLHQITLFFWQHFNRKFYV